MVGTIINVVAVLIGATLGMLLGDRLSPKLRATAMDGLGLVVLVIGLQSALTTHNVLIVLASVVVGGAVGARLDIEAGIEALGQHLEKRFAPATDQATSRFSKGFLTASLVFCVGPMTILGSIQDGLTGDFRTLAVKSLLDFFAAVAFASTLGIGVMFSALTVLLYQGGLTLLASGTREWLTDPMIREMSAVGGVLIMGIGVRLLELKPVAVGNLLPGYCFSTASSTHCRRLVGYAAPEQRIPLIQATRPCMCAFRVPTLLDPRSWIAPVQVRHENPECRCGSASGSGGVLPLFARSGLLQPG